MTPPSTPRVAPRFLREMLTLPTAPFAEHAVMDYIVDFCAQRSGLDLTSDAAGNMLVRVRIGRRAVPRPVCITAHLDHPGFVADRMIAKTKLRAFWRGGVPPEYFVKSGVRFFVDDRWVPGRVRSVKTSKAGGRRHVDTAVIDVAHAVPSGSVGMWDLPDPKVRGSRIHARACDDIAGAAAIITAIDRLVRSKRPCDAYFLFTRAEEVGFVGAIAAAKRGTIPKRCIVIAMETSSERPHARLGDGPIMRVGDRISVFSPGATAFCTSVAVELADRDKRFRFQRTLMDGGTCESSAFCALGYDATGICVALGNYHNVNAKRKKIGAEYIDLDDYDNAVKWFVALARARCGRIDRDDAFRKKLGGIEREYRTLLRETVDPQ